MITKTIRDNKGLTLVELLITIAVIAIVAVILFPTVNNVIGASNQRAADQNTTNITNFVSKWTSSGTYTYNPDTQEFTGYADTNGDGTTTEDEAVERLGVDKGKFTVVRTDGGDGQAPATDAPSASYSSVPDDSYTVILNNGAVLAAPSTVPFAQGFDIYGNAVCQLEPACTNDTALYVLLSGDAQKAGEAPYTSFTVEFIEVAFKTGSFSADEVPTDWSTATVFSKPYNRTDTLRGNFYLENLDPAKRYFFRVQIVNSEGAGPFSEAVGLYYSSTRWIYQSEADIGNSIRGTE